MWAREGFFTFSLLLVSLVFSVSSAEVKKSDSFEIDYAHNQFLLNGKPFRYVSGSFHYFRAPRQKWRDILRKMRAAGLNAVSTYVEWSMHEPEPNKWVWDGDADIVEFIKIAEEEDLLVILRPGPYICAERDFGGFPYWLLTLVPDIHLRTKDDRYLFYAERFLNQILEKTKPYLRGKGGPIIMVQVENEYGSFYSCDSVYKRKLYKIFHRHVGDDAVLFTTDGPARNMLKCGSMPGVYATIDFGSGANVTYNSKIMREFSPKGPLVNSEYYPGWLTHWTEPFQRVPSARVVKTLDEMLAANYSVNIYMFYGGTNFGFTSGANINEHYWPQITSYDYDAPLTEAGDPTPKYFDIRNVISKYLPLPNLKTPTEAPKSSFGKIPMTPVLDLFSVEARRTFGTRQDEFVDPPTFEALGLPHWLVLYEANLPTIKNKQDVSTLHAVTKDRALVYVNEKLHGALNRMDGSYSINIPNNGTRRLKLLVENMGRVNYGDVDVEDFKGIFDVHLNNVTITPWKATGFRLSSVTPESFKVRKTLAETGTLYNGPQFLVSQFEINGTPRDTFLNTKGWGKGVAYVNGHNLGRYWPEVGPQFTLYVPAAYLQLGLNSLVLLELDNVPSDRSIEFQNTPVLDFEY